MRMISCDIRMAQTFVKYIISTLKKTGNNYTLYVMFTTWAAVLWDDSSYKFIGEVILKINVV
jgi:hypothetical protein